MKPACPLPPELADPIGDDEPIMKVLYFGDHHRSSSKRPTSLVTSKEVVIMYEEQQRKKEEKARRWSVMEQPKPTVPIRRSHTEKNSNGRCRSRITSCFQFFESINPKSDFRNEEALENYLYQKSLEIQPKGVDPPTNDTKPKHNGNTLRSPGVKPPKAGNHYSPSHVHQSNTVPSTPVLFHDTKRSLSHAPPDESSSSSSSNQQFERSRLQKIAPLQPPPLLPRSRAPPPSNLNSLPPTTIAPMVPTPKSSAGIMSSPTSTPSSSSSSSVPPKLHPRRAVAKSPMVKSPLTDHNSAFQFPDCAAPPLPPRPSTSSESPNFKENTEHLTIFAREDCSSSSSTTTAEAATIARSPTVRLSVPLPPALPPPRGTSSVYNKPPPPLPPKSYRSSNNSSPPIASSPTADPTSPSIFVNLPPSGTTPPPLPPKTYKRTNM